MYVRYIATNQARRERKMGGESVELWICTAIGVFLYPDHPHLTVA